MKTLARAVPTLLIAVMLAGAACARAPASPAPVQGVRVVATFPHDRTAFTEGLFFQDGSLFESTGYEGQSWVRRSRLETGEVLQERSLDRRYFGEGVVAWKDRLLQLTWQGHIGFVYDLKTFAPKGSFAYPGEGWALTHDGRRILMSDGTPDLRVLDPVTLKQTGRIRVTDAGRPVANLNELEFIKGEVWANVWQTDRIARIDPRTGHVIAWLDLTDLLGEPHGRGAPCEPDVLNGIAYDAAGDRILVTGKYWPRIYQIALTPLAGR